jgi:uncharacterized repeat protein (TIGR01451 family)
MQVTATGYLKKAARVFLIVLVVSLLVVFSAGDVLALFTNGGFESGDFTGWTKATYLNPGLTLPLPFTGADINRTAGGGDLTSVLGPFPALTQSDPNTGGVLKYPFSGQYSAVINYMGFNRNANSLTQQTTTVAGDVQPDGMIHIGFAWAAVVQDPSHPAEEQPYIYVAVKNVTQSTLLYEKFIFANQTDPIWQIESGNPPVLFTDWQSMDIAPSITDLAVGDTIELEAIASGCSPSAHWGYLYVDGFAAAPPQIHTADLAITKTDNPDPVIAGNDLNYVITVTNNGPFDATGVSVSDSLPAGVTYKSDDTHGKGTYNSGTGVWDVGGLVNLDTATLDLVVTVNSATPSGNITNNVTVTGIETDPDLTNNTAATITEVIIRTDLTVTKTGNPDPAVNAGSDLTYTITATNNGPSNATGIIVKDTLPPAGITFKSATPSQGTYNNGTGEWAVGALSKGGTATLTLVVNINAPAVDLTVLTNKVEITGNEIDPVTSNNGATEETTVYAPVMKTTKTDSSSGAVNPGDIIKYTVIVKNDGNGPATGVMFTDTPDMNTTLVIGSVTTNGGFVTKGNIAGNIVEVNIGTVAPHSQVTITFDVTINKPLWVSQITNQGSVNGANFSSLKTDDSTTAQLNDPTLTEINSSAPVHGPSMSEWGIILLATLLGGGMVWMIRRKQIRSETH